MIYRHRGLGKSSLALQAQLIATGERELLVKQGDSDWAIDEENSYVSVYVQCSDGTSETKHILRRIINGLLLLPQAANTACEEHLREMPPYKGATKIMGNVNESIRKLSAERVKLKVESATIDWIEFEFVLAGIFPGILVSVRLAAHYHGAAWRYFQVSDVVVVAATLLISRLPSVLKFDWSGPKQTVTYLSAAAIAGACFWFGATLTVARDESRSIALWERCLIFALAALSFIAAAILVEIGARADARREVADEDRGFERGLRAQIPT
jgi:hypothetical protein